MPLIADAGYQSFQTGRVLSLSLWTVKDKLPRMISSPFSLRQLLRVWLNLLEKPQHWHHCCKN